jgi:hypothetical protein
MTVFQMTLQPFGTLNSLRGRFMIPCAVTTLLRVGLFSPKNSFIYKTLGKMRRDVPDPVTDLDLWRLSVVSRSRLDVPGMEH